MTAAAGPDPGALVARHEPIVYVADLAAPEVDPTDLHHLRRVRRLRDGAAICLCDGSGGWQPAELHQAGVRPTADPRREPAPHPTLTVAVSVPKGDRADWLVQKVTELGIDAIVVVETERSVVRWPQDRALQRLGRVARAAAAQSRRAFLPDISGPRPFAEVASGPGVALAQPGGGPPTPDHRTILIGPEGGWSPAELGVGLRTVGLGPLVLRVETAAMAATTLLVALRSQQVSFARSPRENALGG